MSIEYTDIEGQLLAAAMANPIILQTSVAPADFSGGLGKAWEHARKMVRDGHPTDAVSIGTEMGGEWIAVLGSITMDFGSMVANGDYAAGIVKMKGLERRAAEIATRFADGKIDKTALISQIRALDLERELPAQTAYSTMEQLVAFLDCPPEAIQTGIGTIDDRFSGVHKGDLNIIQARPGIGKTAMAITMALSMIKEKNEALFVTGEMPAHQIMGRMVSQITGLPSYKMRSGKLSDEEWAKVADCGADIKDLPLYLSDPSVPRMTDIEATARKIKETKGLDVIFIDYAQRIKLGRVGESFRMEQVEIAKGMKAMARELDVAVMLLAQSHRRVDEYDAQNYGRMPRQGDIGESSQYEQEADMILSIARIDERAAVDVCKNRHGPVGMVLMDFVPETMIFREQRGVAMSMPAGHVPVPQADHKPYNGDQPLF